MNYLPKAGIAPLTKKPGTLGMRLLLLQLNSSSFLSFLVIRLHTVCITATTNAPPLCALLQKELSAEEATFSQSFLVIFLLVQ